MQYETFLCRAFGLIKGENVPRYGDPASIADTDNYRPDYIDSVKAGVAYSMEIFNHKIENIHELEDNELERIRGFTHKVIVASSIQDITNLINDYVDSVERKYVPRMDGVNTLK